jgi:hypothetical protein
MVKVHTHVTFKDDLKSVYVEVNCWSKDNVESVIGKKQTWL